MSTENNPVSKGKKLFKVGEVANPNGRPAGSQNKITTQMKETMHDIFLANKDKVQEKLDELKDPKDWLNFFVQLYPYFMPKLNATRAEITVRQTGAEHLSDPELTKMFLEIVSTEKETPSEHNNLPI